MAVFSVGSNSHVLQIAFDDVVGFIRSTICKRPCLTEAKRRHLRSFSLTLALLEPPMDLRLGPYDVFFSFFCSQSV